MGGGEGWGSSKPPKANPPESPLDPPLWKNKDTKLVYLYNLIRTIPEKSVTGVGIQLFFKGYHLEN